MKDQISKICKTCKSKKEYYCENNNLYITEFHLGKQPATDTKELIAEYLGDQPLGFRIRVGNNFGCVNWKQKRA